MTVGKTGRTAAAVVHRHGRGRLGTLGEVTNRLARSTSPYLLQHAENPVDWWEWGDEAFAAARARDVPGAAQRGVRDLPPVHWLG